MKRFAIRRIRLDVFIVLIQLVVIALIVGIILGHPGDMRMEASTL